MFRIPTFGQFSNCVKHLHLLNKTDNFHYLHSFSIHPTTYLPAFSQTKLVLCLDTFHCILLYPTYDYSDWLRAGRSGYRIAVGPRFSASVQTGPGAHPVFCTMGTGSFSRIKSGRGVRLTPHSLLVPWS